MKFSILVIILTLSLLGKEKYYIDKDTKVTQNIAWQITTGLSIVNTSGGDDFYNDYSNWFVPTSERLESLYGYSLGIKIYVYDYMKLHLTGQYYQTIMTHSFYEPFSENSTTGRSLGHVIVQDEIPIVLNFDIIPYQFSQFRTYFGLGIGISHGIWTWTENVNSAVNLDPRSTGERLSLTKDSPILKINLGTELNFDKFGRRKFLGSVYFETSFSYLFRKIDLFSGFENLKEYLLTQEIETNKEYNLNNLVLQLTVGLSLNFYKNKEKKGK
jgi:hypothetical protein